VLAARDFPGEAGRGYDGAPERYRFFPIGVAKQVSPIGASGGWRSWCPSSLSKTDVIPGNISGRMSKF